MRIRSRNTALKLTTDAMTTTFTKAVPVQPPSQRQCRYNHLHTGSTGTTFFKRYGKHIFEKPI